MGGLGASSSGFLMQRLKTRMVKDRFLVSIEGSIRLSVEQNYRSNLESLEMSKTEKNL